MSLLLKVAVSIKQFAKKQTQLSSTSYDGVKQTVELQSSCLVHWSGVGSRIFTKHMAPVTKAEGGRKL